MLFDEGERIGRCTFVFGLGGQKPQFIRLTHGQAAYGEIGERFHDILLSLINNHIRGKSQNLA
jgi:hypothetical protein